MTITVSSRRMRAISLQHLRGKRDDLHEVALAQLAGDRSEDARAPRVVLRVDQHGRVLVERDVRAVVAPELLAGADDDSGDDLALLHRSLRARLLDRGHDGVADAGVAPARAAADPDAE